MSCLFVLVSDSVGKRRTQARRARKRACTDPVLFLQQQLEACHPAAGSDSSSTTGSLDYSSLPSLSGSSSHAFSSSPFGAAIPPPSQFPGGLAPQQLQQQQATAAASASSLSLSTSGPPYSLSSALALASAAGMSAAGGTPAAAAAAAAALAAGAAAAVSGGGGVSAPLLPHCPLLLSTFALQQQSGGMIGNLVVGAGGGSASALGTGPQQQLSPWGASASGGVPLGPTQLMAGNAIYSAVHLALMTVPPPPPPLQLLQQGENAAGVDGDEVKELGAERARQEESGELDEPTIDSTGEHYAGKKDEGSADKDFDRAGGRRQTAAKLRDAVEEQLVTVASMLRQLEALRVSVAGARNGTEGDGDVEKEEASDFKVEKTSGCDSTRERTKEAGSPDAPPGGDEFADAALGVRERREKRACTEQPRGQGENAAASLRSRDARQEGGRGRESPDATPRRLFTAYDVRGAGVGFSGSMWHRVTMRTFLLQSSACCMSPSIFFALRRLSGFCRLLFRC